MKALRAGGGEGRRECSLGQPPACIMRAFVGGGGVLILVLPFVVWSLTKHPFRDGGGGGVPLIVHDRWPSCPGRSTLGVLPDQVGVLQAL